MVFGGDFLGSVVHLGDNTANTLTGTAAAETFVGGQGDDIMAGNGGADAFQGGEADDVIGVIGATALRIDGGTGYDTLRLDGAGDTFDFSVILPATVDSVEATDLTGTGDSILGLNLLDVFDLSDDTALGVTTLTVLGNEGDTVDLLDSADWTNAGPSGDFTIFTNGAGRLLVDSDISVI